MRLANPSPKMPVNSDAREIEEGSFAAFFQMPGVTAAEIGFDQRSPERPHVISAGFGAVVCAQTRGCR